MDISLRMWLFIILGVLILGILIDGLRRWRQHQRNPYRLSLGEVHFDETADDPLRHVFPSGGARPVDPGKLEPLLKTNQPDTRAKSAPEPLQIEKTDSFFSRHTKQKKDSDEKQAKDKKKKSLKEPLDLTESVPVLMDSVTITGLDDEYADAIDESLTEQDDFLGKTQPLFSEVPNIASDDSEKQTDDAQDIQEAIVLNVFARDTSGFQGEPLLEILLESGLRYGDMSIFHRHQSPAGEGKVLFSVANAVNPGTFKIEAMNKFSTKGLSFFFGLPGPLNAMETFDLMLETAQYFTKKLNGELKDDKRSVMTAQTIEHYRQRIRDFERRHLAQ